MPINLEHAGVATAVAAMITLGASWGPAIATAARDSTVPKPAARVLARRMGSRPGFPAPRFGAPISLGDAVGARVFINGKIGFALANDESATVPARTTDGGRRWTIDGPQFHVDAADGAEAVGSVGIVSPNTEFAYGSSVVDVSTDAGRTWWEAFLGENVTAVVPGAHGLVAFVQQSVSNEHLNPIVTWQYVSTDGGRHWRYSKSFAAIG